MTIFNPSKQKENTKFLVYLTIIVLVGGVGLVLEYNKLAAFRAEERALTNNIERARVKNAELKSDLYAETDPVRLEEVASNSALVLDTSPEYFTYSE